VTQYRVVPYHSSMSHEIVRLWQESHASTDVSRRLSVFRWFTEQNPFLRGRSAYWCLHDGSRVVGMHGHMPVIFDVDGQERPGHLAQDDLLHPAARGKGLGQRLLDGVRDAEPHLAAVMWLNEANHSSYRKAGWTDVHGFRHYVRVLDPERLARAVSNATIASLVRVGGSIALRVIDLPGRMRRRGDVRLEPLERFDERFDALWERARPHFGISVRRSAEYLNWRYVAMPTQDHQRLAAITAAGEASGYVVWRPVPAGGRLVVRVLDMGWDPQEPGVLEALLLAVVAAARGQRATQVVCAAAHPTLVHALRALGFLPSRREEPHMVSNWEGLLTREDVTDIRRWHLTLGDADGDVWSDEAMARDPTADKS